MDRTIKTPKTGFQEMAPRNSGASISKRDLTNLETPRVPINKQMSLQSDGVSSSASVSTSHSTLDEKLFIYNYYLLILNQEMERFEYSNLPEGLTKTRIEKKICENGSALLFRIGSEFVVANFIQEADNIYGETTIARVVESKSPAINNKMINILKGEGVILRNNSHSHTKFWQVIRYLKDMEAILFQIEKNIPRSAPKILVDTNKTQFQALSNEGIAYELDTMEDIINSQDSAFAIKTKGAVENALNNNNFGGPFVVLQTDDKTDALWKNFNSMKQQLEELCGVRMSGIDNEKAERKVQAEISQHFSIAELQNAYNTRQEDIKKVNQLFNLNIGVDYQKDLRPEDEDIQKEVKDDIQ